MNPTDPTATPRFVVLEGIDGAGTTTQLHRLAAWLEAKGRAVLSTFEPTDNPIGRQIRRILRRETTAPHDSIALLFAADRLDHLARDIEPALAAGAWVLCDRYLGSSLAYQGTHSDPSWVAMINGHARAPDVTFYVRVRPEVALERIAARDGDKRDLFETRETLERIAAAYDRIYGVGSDPVLDAVVVDGERSQDEVFDALTAALTATS